MNYSQPWSEEYDCLRPYILNISDDENGQLVYCEQPVASSFSQRTVVMVLFMAMALVGNCGVLIVLYRTKKIHQPVSAFLVSLAASDILIALFSMPTEVFWDAFGGWIFGSFACKSLTYLQFILFASTAHIHMCISYDRYEAICKPITVSKRIWRNHWMIAGSWLLAFVMAIPQLIIFVQVNVGLRADGTFIAQCTSTGYTAEWQRKFYVTWIAVYMFLIPLICIGYCYSKILSVVRRYDRKLTNLNEPDAKGSSMSPIRKITSTPSTEVAGTLSRAKMKTIQVTVCILVSYTFCWTPYFTVQLLNVWSDYAYRDSINASSAGVLAQCLCWFSSCVNPIIYGCFHLPTGFHKTNSCCCYDRSPRSLTVNGRKLPYRSSPSRPYAHQRLQSSQQPLMPTRQFQRNLTKSESILRRPTRSDGSDQPLVIIIPPATN